MYIYIMLLAFRVVGPSSGDGILSLSVIRKKRVWHSGDVKPRRGNLTHKNHRDLMGSSRTHEWNSMVKYPTKKKGPCS